MPSVWPEPGITMAFDPKRSHYLSKTLPDVLKEFRKILCVVPLCTPQYSYGELVSRRLDDSGLSSRPGSSDGSGWNNPDFYQQLADAT